MLIPIPDSEDEEDFLEVSPEGQPEDSSVNSARASQIKSYDFHANNAERDDFA